MFPCLKFVSVGCDVIVSIPAMIHYLLMFDLLYEHTRTIVNMETL